jgi:Phosphoserine phosphatase RsbU, N-terminal domain
VSAQAGPFRAAYASSLAEYLREPTESALRAAYELGREGVRRKLSVMDLALAHQEALVSALSGVFGRDDAQRITRAAGDFFLESLASFEMVQRGSQEAREAVRSERRSTELSRRLSTFLADASLALDARDSLGEILQLVAEQARELVGGACCVATVALGGTPRSAEGASYAQDDRHWTVFAQWLDLVAVYRLLRQSGGVIRLAGEQLDGLAPFRAARGERPVHGWLAVSLSALDGGELGAIQLFDKPDGAFSADDEASLVHLAQMASAAVDRALLYRDWR